MNRFVSRLGTYPLALLILVLAGLYVIFSPRVIARPDETWTRIQNEHVLRIGIDPSFPPFEADDGQGHLSGFEITLAYALAEKFSVGTSQLVRVEFVYTGFDGLYDGLGSRQYDLILSALPYNPQKTEDVSFSHAYYDGGPIIITRSGGSSRLSLYDLAGKRVAVELGSTGDMLLRRWMRRLQLDVRRFDTARRALDAVQANETDAALVDSLSFREFQREQTRQGEAASPLRIASVPLEHEYLVIAARKDSGVLLKNINEALEEWTKAGRLDEMLKNELGMRQNERQGDPPHLVSLSHKPPCPVVSCYLNWSASAVKLTPDCCPVFISRTVALPAMASSGPMMTT